MAFDFPNSPSEGQRFSPGAGAPTYVYKSPSWELVTVTGVTIGDAAPANPLPGQTWWESDTGNTYLWVDDGNSQQWVQVNGVGISKPQADAAYVSKAGDVMTGTLAINANTPVVNLNKTAAGQHAVIQGALNDKMRWLMSLGNTDPESGSNAGSNLALYRYDDAGTYLGAPLTINRSTADATFSANVFCTGLIGTTVYAAQNFISSSPNVVLSTSSNTGEVHLRPRGYSDGTCEVFIDYIGNLRADLFYPPAGRNGGFKCKDASGNIIGGNYFNFYWTTALNGYVDNTWLGSLSFSSDYRVKKDVVDLPSTWETVKALRPIKYTQAQFTPPDQIKAYAAEKKRQEALRAGKENAPAYETPGPMFTADDKERWGFLAHELQETMIEDAATATKDAPDAIQSPNPWTIIAALTKTVQEMQARIEALEAGGA